MGDLLLAGENKIKINEAKQSQRSAAPACLPTSLVGDLTLHALLRVSSQMMVC